MDSLATKINRREVRRGLENLPTDVNAMYDETMKRIKGQIEGDRQLAELVLCWIIYARRQLRLEELRHAIAVSPKMMEMNTDALVDEAKLTEMDTDALVDEDILTSVCAGLIVVDNQSTIVHLVRK